MFAPAPPTRRHLLTALSRAPILRSRRLANLAEDVKSDETFRIPVIPFRQFQDANSRAEKLETARNVVSAFKEVGFVYLSDHGIPHSQLLNVFSQSKQFFDLPLQTKATLAWDDPRSNRGFVQQGRERVTQSSDPEEILKLRAQAPDVKETMEIGRDWGSVWKNKWPEPTILPDFKSTMLNFFQMCHNLHVSVMSSVAMGLDLPEDFFASMINEQYHNLRLLHYPTIVSETTNNEVHSRAGAHSDYGSLTFVFQDNIGGLEVQNPHTGQFHPATPIPNTVVVNVGDLLQRWSNDVLRSTLHRVVTPKGKATALSPARQSIAFFCNPNGGAKIAALPTCISSDRPPKYQPVETEQYIVQRLTDTYS